MKFGLIIQARMLSSRLPGKVLKKVYDKYSVLDILLERLKTINNKDLKLIVATSSSSLDDPIEDCTKKHNIYCFRGDLHNVLSRFLSISKLHNFDYIFRVTADCPLIDPNQVKIFINDAIKENFDYASNTLEETYPDGFDLELFKPELLKSIADPKNKLDIEHVTPSIRSSKNIIKKNYFSEFNYSKYRLTVDTKEDLELIKRIIEISNGNILIGYKEIIDILSSNPRMELMNNFLVRNEGMKQKYSTKLWSQAKSRIPGGNHLLSKRPTQFLKEDWPSYFSKAHGIEIETVDGEVYKDFSIFGIGTNSLGYGNAAVDKAVMEAIRSGNMSTLNCPEEVMLAEKLVELNPWADMVRFARSGGEANAIAIRIARAASGRDKVAVCGYHGWHDWYLSANIASTENLEGLLLPGLTPNGVPKVLKDTTYTFEYNNIQSFLDVINKEDIGVVKMEVTRNHLPKDGFLETIRQECTKRSIVLIFDECTSGFRETFGGIFQKFNITPDVAMFGKALGNGYAITAVVGKREIMDAAQSTFISSTFWTERIGFAAGIATLNEMEKLKSWEIITGNGEYFRESLSSAAKSQGYKISFSGLPALSVIEFSDDQTINSKTYFTQEMLKRGYLASNLFYASVLHSHDEINLFCDQAAEVFLRLSEIDPKDVINELDSGPSDSGFKRLN